MLETCTGECLFLFRALEAELEEEWKREEEREQRRETDRESTRHNQLEERKVKDIAEIEKMHISQDEKDRLMREHTANMDKFEENLKKEQMRGREALQAKLDARRAQRASVSRAKLLGDAVMRDEDSWKRELMGQDMDEVPVRKPVEGKKTAAPAAGN